MFKSLKRSGIMAALAVGAMTVGTTSAEARDRYWGHRGNDDAALAIGAGVIGLALGAAIASSGRDRYYDDGYYYRRGGYYGYPRYYRGYPRGYYYDRYPRRSYYGGDRGWRGSRHGGWGGGRYGGWGY